jgi:hypothetical protein
MEFIMLADTPNYGSARMVECPLGSYPSTASFYCFVWDVVGLSCFSGCNQWLCALNLRFFPTDVLSTAW